MLRRCTRTLWRATGPLCAAPTVARLPSAQVPLTLLKDQAVASQSRGFASVVYPPALADIGKQAPSFSEPAVMPDGEIKSLSLADYKGKWLVLLFYPKDWTFVCPTELIAFSDAVDKFHKIGAEVVGVSTDTPETHLAWIRHPRKKGGLGRMNIPLLADVTKVVSAEYGTLLKDAGIALRGLFIIDPDSVLQQATINNLPVGRSVDETLRLLQAFQFVREHGEVCPAGWTPGAATMKADTEGAKSYFAAQEELEFNATIPKLSSQQEINAALAAHKAVVLDWYAPWCGKCAQIAPHVDDLKEKHKGVQFFKVDTDASVELAAKYDARVLPTFVMFQSGKEVARISGYKKQALADAVASLKP